MTRSLACTVFLFLIFVGTSLQGADNDPYRLFPSGDRRKREAILEGLLARLPADVKDDAFTRYLRRTGELPPDFDLLPSEFFLPDPLTRTIGGVKTRVTREQWAERRAELAKLTELWLLGAAPPPPGNVVGEVLEKTIRDGHQVWKVRLSFGPNHAATLGVTLFLPKSDRPSPVFLCDSERYLPWVEKAMKHGFGFVVHNARDGEHDESLGYTDLFGDYDWSAFRRRGWSASRVLDWLETLPFIDPDMVFIGGHSRSAKAALTAAAFDQRFAGVIASSPGSGGSLPYRYCDQSYFGESAELLTRKFSDWVHPRVRMFAGNEDKLPADNHFLYALIAPRPVLMSTATEDAVESSWAVEQVYFSVQPVYALLGAPSNLVLRYRRGGHRINDNATLVAYSDFLLAAAAAIAEAKANRAQAKNHQEENTSSEKDACAFVDKARETVVPILPELFPFRPIHPWDYNRWAAQNPIDVQAYPEIPQGSLLDPLPSRITPNDWPAERERIRENLQWLIGEQPAYIKLPVAFGPSVNVDNVTRNHFEKIVDLVGRAEDGEGKTSDPQVTATLVRFGGGINGCLYVPRKDRGLPVVIWLGPFQTSQGYMAPFYRCAVPAPVALLRAGFPVFTYDPLGTFLRQEERRTFFETYPNGSLMAQMVCDARHAIDAATEVLPSPRPVYLYGYAMGGMVALFTASLDDRVAAVASVAGFTPLRTDTADRRTGGLARLSHLYGWLPKLGAFIGNERRIPVDFPEILAAIAPRKTLIVAPIFDRYANHDEVQAAVQAARRVYQLLGEERGIELYRPEDENRLTDSMQRKVIEWFLSWSAS